MADRVQYLEYAVYLDDKELAENYQAAYPNGVRISPDAISAQLAIPIVLHALTTPFTAPSIRSAYFTATSKYPRDVAEFTTCRGGWFGICALFGRVTTYKWVAKYYWVPTPVATIEGVPVGAPAAMGARYWIDGFDMKADDAAGAWGGGNQPPVNRGSSRHVDGLGFAAHGIDDGGEYFQHSFTEQAGAVNARTCWQRFYMRVRSAPSSQIEFMHFADVPNACVDLAITPGLQLAIINVDVSSVRSTLAVSSVALALNTWAKIDVLYEKPATGPNPGRMRVYLKGAIILDVTAAPVNGGINTPQNIGGTRLGVVNTPFDTLAIDFDDWSCMPVPATLDGLDWLNGSRCSLVSPIAVNAGNQFSGDFRSVLRNPFSSTTNPLAQMSSTVAGNALIVDTDAAYTIDKVNGSLGCSAIKVKLVATGLTGTSSIGYSINGAAAVMTNFTEPNSANTPVFRTAMYRPAQAAFADVTPLTLNFTREAPAGTKQAFCFVAEAELIGVFGDEDITAEAIGAVTTQIPPRLGPHNNPYPDSIWARLAIPPTAPVIVVAGTYTGNGTGQDLTFRAPVNFFLSRRVPVSGTRLGVNWWSSMIGSHDGTTLTIGTSAGMIRASVDTTFVPIGGVNDPEERYLLRIAGDEPNSNENAIVYQYIAFIDPGARFLSNGSFHHQNAAAVTETLTNAAFLPKGLWFFLEAISGGGASQFFKGPGNTVDQASKFDSIAALASMVTMATGSLVTGANGQLPEGVHFSYAAWRTDDGSGDPNVAKVVKIGSYVGNGSASRTIGFAPATGLRPLYAIIVPDTATATIRRDPSHTGTISTDTAGNDNAAMGIMSGGIDEMTVGLALNANTVVYNWFVFMGSATAGNNGWSINGEFAYVEPDYDGPAVAEPPVFVDPDVPTPPDTDPDPDPGPSDDDDCGDPDSVCIAATTRIANVALTHIGVTKLLSNYCTQNSTEAQVVRALYEDSVRKVLRDFPWPFATKYAVLGLSASQPSNQDWTYSYRMPVDCIFERRLVTDRDRAVNPEPPPFMLSSDASGGLILTNQAAAVLEYTCRPVCVAFASDTLFREALGWHLAGALAPPLTRMTDVAAMCYKKYGEALEKAHQVIKPGVPGTRDAADPTSPDAAAACITANVLVANTGLLRIGARTIANMSTEQSREAAAVALIFEQELRATLRDYSWKFAKRYNSTLVRVAGTSTVPVNSDWQYSYRLPTDYVAARRLVTEGTGRDFDAEPPRFEVGTDATGDLLFAHAETPLLEYTARINCAVDKADELFKDALAWRMAAALAPSLAQVDPEMPEQHGRGPEDPPSKDMRIRSRPNKAAMRIQIAQMARQMYERTIIRARVADANEAQTEEPPDAEWIRGRR